MNFDRTYVAASRQLKVMNCAQYEIGIFNRMDDFMLLREWNAEMILKSLGYLKRMNAQDRDIFIRPFGPTGLIFFDDFNRAMLARLNDDGLTPALIIQSSPLNYHGWIKISDSPLDEALCTAGCKVIAEKYGGDDGSAKFRQFGRLAGFTNRKPKYVDEEGKRPFVLLDEAKGQLADHAGQLLSEAVDYMSAAENERNERVALFKSITPDLSLNDSSQFYLSELNGLIRRYGSEINYSKADWVIVNKMLKRGYPRGSIESVLLEHSPHLHGRSSSNSFKYVELTLDIALGIKVNKRHLKK